jgi:hypothetical protein
MVDDPEAEGHAAVEAGQHHQHRAGQGHPDQSAQEHSARVPLLVHPAEGEQGDEGGQGQEGGRLDPLLRFLAGRLQPAGDRDTGGEYAAAQKEHAQGREIGGGHDDQAEDGQAQAAQQDGPRTQERLGPRRGGRNRIARHRQHS